MQLEPPEGQLTSAPEHAPDAVHATQQLVAAEQESDCTHAPCPVQLMAQVSAVQSTPELHAPFAPQSIVHELPLQATANEHPAVQSTTHESPGGQSTSQPLPHVMLQVPLSYAPPRPWHAAAGLPESAPGAPESASAASRAASGAASAAIWTSSVAESPKASSAASGPPSRAVCAALSDVESGALPLASRASPPLLPPEPSPGVPTDAAAPSPASSSRACTWIPRMDPHPPKRSAEVPKWPRSTAVCRALTMSPRRLRPGSAARPPARRRRYVPRLRAP
jgi:hypothetical protein